MSYELPTQPANPPRQRSLALSTGHTRNGSEARLRTLKR